MEKIQEIREKLEWILDNRDCDDWVSRDILEALALIDEIEKEEKAIGGKG